MTITQLCSTWVAMWRTCSREQTWRVLQLSISSIPNTCQTWVEDQICSTFNILKLWATMASWIFSPSRVVIIVNIIKHLNPSIRSRYCTALAVTELILTKETLRIVHLTTAFKLMSPDSKRRPWMQALVITWTTSTSLMDLICSSPWDDSKVSMSPILLSLGSWVLTRRFIVIGVQWCWTLAIQQKWQDDSDLNED